jgi:hypothetical protein
MRKLFTILSFLFCSVICFGQFPVKQSIGSQNTLVQVPQNADTTLVGGLQAGIINRTFKDTTSANNTNLKYYPGAQIFILTTNTFWIRNSTANMWIEVSNVSVVSQIPPNIGTGFREYSPQVPGFKTFKNSYGLNWDSLTSNSLTPRIDSNLWTTQSKLAAGVKTFQNGIGPYIVGSNLIEFGSAPLYRNTLLDLDYNTLTFSDRVVYDYGTKIEKYRSFQGGTGVVDFIHSNFFTNAVSLGINYTGAVYLDSLSIPGYMNNQIGYWIGVNATGEGSFGLRTENIHSKVSGIFINTTDSLLTDAITFFAKHPPNPNFVAAISSYQTLEPYRILTLHDNKNVTWYGYPSTRNDGSVVSGQSIYYPDASGNMKVGTITFSGGGSTITNIGNGYNVGVSGTNNIKRLRDSTYWKLDSLISGTLHGYIDTSGLFTAVRNTVALYTSSNGLTKVDHDFQLGGSALTGNSSILTSVYSLTINSSNSTQTLAINNTDASTGVGVVVSSINRAIVSSGTTGIQATGTTLGVWAIGSGSGSGLQANATNGNAITGIVFPSSTNTIVNVASLQRLTSSTPANGIGGAISFTVQDLAGTATANTIVSKWADVTHATRTSQFVITGVSSAVTADLLTLSGNGALKLNNYGTGGISGTPAFCLAVDASGNVIEVACGGGGGGGSVNSVAGTTNRITSTGGTDPIIDISASYKGQSSIDTLGTIATGTWNATAIATGKGGNPTAGAIHQVLTKNSSTNYDYSWSEINLAYSSTFRTVAISGGAGTGATIPLAMDDGATVGLSSYTASDFNVSGAGNVTIDYTNGQAATGSVKGFLTAADWTTFNNKGAGTVTTASIVTNQGVSGSVATATTTPAITLSLGALTGVTSLNGLVVTANTGVITTGTWNGTAIAIANGGTGQTTANAAFNALAPSQTSNSGKFMTTDGTNTSWATATGTNPPLSTITDAVAGNTINNLAYAQSWGWSILGSTIGMTFASTSTAAASNSQELVRFSLSGTNSTSSQTTTTAKFFNTHAGTGAVNIAALFQSTGGATNYSAQFPRGKVAFGLAGTETAVLELNGLTSGTATITVPSIAGTPTLTLPTITGTLVQYAETSITSSATPTPTGDARENHLYITALATNPTFAAPSGTAINGNKIIIRCTDNGSARTFTFNSIYEGSTDIPLPSGTTAGLDIYMCLMYNSSNVKWQLVGLTNGF